MAAKITRKVMQLKFMTGDGKELKMTVNDPKEDITGEELSVAMDKFIAANCFADKGSTLATKTGAAYIIQSSDEIELA